MTSDVNHSDRGLRSYDADYDPSKFLLNRLFFFFLQRQSMSSPAPRQAPSSTLVSTSQCHHMTVRLVNPINQALQQKRQSLVCHRPLCQFIGHHSDATETPDSCVDQNSVSAADCISVFQAASSDKQVLELWPILFGAVDVSGSDRLLRQFRRQWHAIAIITSVA